MTSANIFIAMSKNSLVTLGLTAGFSIVFTICYHYRKHLFSKLSKKITDEEIVSSLDESLWIEAGEIKELYYYPLKSGRGKTTEFCEFTDYGIKVEEDGFIDLRDRMLLVYDKETGKFRTGRNYPKLVLVTVRPIDKESLRLDADGMPSLVFKVPKPQNGKTNRVECSMWWGEPVGCIDCGSEPAAWISQFLTEGSNTDLRIGATVETRRNILEGPWKKFKTVYKSLRNEDTGFFSDLASYMLLTESSLEELNSRLKEPVTYLRFRPNIVVSGAKAFDEDSWEWIKIGSNVLLRNIKPCPRCSMIYVNPESGTPDRGEPMKTLRSFREQKDPERVRVDGISPTFGVYCGLYKQGLVKIGDPVFVQRFQK